MIGSTNSIWDINNKAGEYEQLVNYTMLYDYGNECVDITGGWSNTYSTDSSSGTYTENSDNIYLYVKNSKRRERCAGTENTIDLYDYSKVIINWLIFCNSAACSCSLSCGNTKGISQATSSNFLAIKSESYITHEIKCISTLDVSNITASAYIQVGALSSNSYTARVNMYSCALLKPDNWQKLAEKSGITAISIDDILTNSSVLLANEQAVDFMIKQCTGDFMASAVASETFLTALNNSPYKTIIMANEHWAKFLAFAS